MKTNLAILVFLMLLQIGCGKKAQPDATYNLVSLERLNSAGIILVRLTSGEVALECVNNGQTIGEKEDSLSQFRSRIATLDGGLFVDNVNVTNAILIELSDDGLDVLRSVNSENDRCPQKFLASAFL